MQHAFPKSITVKSIPLSRADREKIQYKPFRANIGGRFVTLRRMKTNDTGTSDSSSSTKQQTTKMSVRKASDGTYRVTSNSDINTNVLTIKKFKSNNHNSELKKVEALSFVSSDEDNQPSTSSAAFKRKPATSTLSSLVVPKEMSDEEQFVMSSETMPIKQSQPDLQQKTIVNEKEKRISTMLMRNTCFVHTPREPAKHENRLFKSRLQNGIIIRKNTSLLPDHTSYTIPQSLLTSSNVVRKVSASSNEGISNQSVSPQTTSPPNGEDLFMIQEDSNRNQGNVHMNKPGSSRRKSCLEPMDTFDEDTPFEKIREPPNIPPRPRQNIQLIESLARYRTIVRFMLNHLEIHQIDFNNDDYINLYKFYRG